MTEYLLIIANSGRMLAQATRRSGLVPLVIDLYADQDTCALAEAVFRVDALNEPSHKVAIEHFKNRFPVSRTIYGSGLERTPECIDVLEQHFDLLGNDYNSFRKVQDKHHFFALLARLKIPYPKVVFDRPLEQADWLVKPLQGGGGVGICRYTERSVIAPSVYWQKIINGVSGSALFLADGQMAQIIGYNTQWNSNGDSDNEFVFAGIINKTPLSNAQEQVVNNWIQNLVREYGLKGLNTLDFMVQGDEVFVLEINPRPSASLQLYEGDILLSHIKACDGRLEKPTAQAEGYCGYQLVYADSDLQIPRHFHWPEGSVDLPSSGLIIRKGQPICSMIARDKSPQQVYEKLRTTEQIIVNQLKEGQ